MFDHGARKTLCLGAHAQARYTVVCLCVASSHVFLYSYLWICKIKLRSQVMPSFAHLECHWSLFRGVRSKTCSPSVATLLSR